MSGACAEQSGPNFDHAELTPTKRVHLAKRDSPLCETTTPLRSAQMPALEEITPNCLQRPVATAKMVGAVCKAHQDTTISYSEATGLDAETMRNTDEILHKKVDNGEIPGVISVVYRRGRLAHLDMYGYADIEREIPFRMDTIVRLYSMTKCVVSLAAGMLLEAGKFQLEDPISKFIPAFADMQVRDDSEDAQLVPAALPITVLHLMTHTSGLGYGPMLGDDPDGEVEERFVPLITRANLGRESPLDPSAIVTLEHWCDEVAKIPLQAQPGTQWIYSYSYDVLGRLIEVVSGQSLDVFLHREIFEPLGMVDTGFAVPRVKWGRVAGMYRYFEEDQNSDDGAAKEDDQNNKENGKEDGDVEMTDSAQDQEVAPIKKGQLKRLDEPDLEKNAWMEGNESPILSGGGSVDSMTGGLMSTGADYVRFCMMLLNKGEIDGVRILKASTVELFSTNQLPRATGSDDVWAFGSPGNGFSLLGSVSVAHPELDEALRPPEYGWGGMAGTAWTNDPLEDFCLMSFSLTAFDLTTEEELRAGVRAAIAKHDEREAKSQAERKAKAELGSLGKIQRRQPKKIISKKQRTLQTKVSAIGWRLLKASVKRGLQRKSLARQRDAVSP